MMSKFAIKEIRDAKDHELTDLKVDDYLNAIKENRDRIRSLAAMLLTICGMLLSANFIILFFIIKQQSNISFLGILPTYAVILILTVAIAFAILSVNISTPAATITKAQKLNRQLSLYTKERRLATLAIIFLFVGIFGFIISISGFVFSMM